MSNSSYLALFQNAALLLALAVIIDLAARTWQKRRSGWLQVMFGIVIGGIGIVIMLTPWVYVPGIIFDTRSILLGISGLFFGWVPTLIAMLMTAALRISTGGAATVTGVSVIIGTGVIGIMWRTFRRRPLADISWRELLLFGLVLHVYMLICMFFLPWETALNVLSAITLPVLTIYPLATTALGAFLASRIKRWEIGEELRDREERLRLAVGASNIGFFERDVHTQKVSFSPEWKQQLGYEPDELTDESIQWESRLHPEDRERVLAVEKAFASGERPDYEVQYRLRHKDGSYRWILARGERQLDEQGKTLRLLGCHIDLTQQIQAQEAVEASERRFRGLTESSQDAIQLFDRRRRQVYANPAAQKMFNRTAADILGKTLGEAGFREDICAAWEGDLAQVFQDGSSTHRLLDWSGMEGRSFLDLRMYPVQNSTGEVELVLGISRDITAQKEAELALQKSEELYRVLTENIQDVVWILDTESMNFRYVSPSVERLRGYTAREIMDSPIKANFTHDTAEAMIQLIHQRVDSYLSGQEPPNRFYSDEVEQPRKDGSTIWTEIVNSYYTNPETGHVEVRGVTRDITARRQAEAQREAALKAMQASETQYRSLFENMMNGFAHCRMLYEDSVPVDFIYLDVNKAFERLTGLREVVGKRVSEVIPGIRENDPQLFEIYGRVAWTGVPEAFEMYIESLDDWYAVSVYSPKREYFVVIFDVITPRKKAEESLLSTQSELERQLESSDKSRLVLLSMVEDQRMAEEQIRRLNSELEQRVQSRTAQLEAANKELEAFAYSVSHDLRAPLRAMDGFSEALLADHADQLDEQAQHYLRRIREASQRMGQLINDLLNLSRITRTQMNLQTVDLSRLAAEITAELQSGDPSRQVRFEIAQGLAATGDESLLRIALENLLNNAYKFSGKNDQARISFGMLEQSGERVFYVRDNGAGFDMAYAAQLFAPFQRLHAANEFPGTGIGLVTVQRIIAKHGGRVWPDAQPDRGATFYFTLGENE